MMYYVFDQATNKMPDSHCLSFEIKFQLIGHAFDCSAYCIPHFNAGGVERLRGDFGEKKGRTPVALTLMGLDTIIISKNGRAHQPVIRFVMAPRTKAPVARGNCRPEKE